MTPKKIRSWQSIIIKTTIVSAILIGAMYYFGNDFELDMEESYEDKIVSISQLEDMQPTDFLTLEGNYNKSFWGTEFKVKGNIVNNATVADYKDIIIRITFYSKTNTVIGTRENKLYEVYPPNSTTPFQFNVKNYKDVNSISCEIVEAIPN